MSEAEDKPKLFDIIATRMKPPTRGAEEIRGTIVLTLRIPKRAVEELDELVADGYFMHRSEAIRQAIYLLIDLYNEIRSRRRRR